MEQYFIINTHSEIIVSPLFPNRKAAEDIYNSPGNYLKDRAAICKTIETTERKDQK